MRSESRSDLEVSVPNFKSSIPSDRGKVRFKLHFALGFKKRRISHTRDPFSVVRSFTGEFTVSEIVP